MTFIDHKELYFLRKISSQISIHIQIANTINKYNSLKICQLSYKYHQSFSTYICIKIQIFVYMLIKCILQPEAQPRFAMADIPSHQVLLCQSQTWSPSILQVCENQPDDEKPQIQMEFVKDHFDL